jgi:hypothetical protein
MPATTHVEREFALARPFALSNLDAMPEGWRVRPPDFVGVASGKAGTSWWYRLLSEHPEVVKNRLNRKELNYFQHFGYNGLGAREIQVYREAFASPAGGICGEWSPSYLNFPLAIDSLAAAAPEAKVIAIVRNPVDRTLSDINQRLSRRAPMLGLQGEALYVYATFSVYPDAFWFSQLTQPFVKLLRRFRRAQILLLQYEECRRNPGDAIRRTYRFLHIDESFQPPSLHAPVNRKPYLIPPVAGDIRSKIAEYFRDDVEAFFRLFPEVDRSLWQEYAHGSAR